MFSSLLHHYIWWRLPRVRKDQPAFLNEGDERTAQIFNFTGERLSGRQKLNGFHLENSTVPLPEVVQLFRFIGLIKKDVFSGFPMPQQQFIESPFFTVVAGLSVNTQKTSEWLDNLGCTE